MQLFLIFSFATIGVLCSNVRKDGACVATYALVDGGITTAEYLWRNGIRPAHILFSASDLEEATTYCDKDEDDVLIIISGCTTLSHDAVKAVMGMLQVCETVRSVTILSSIPLYVPRLAMPYYLFEGDLISGTYWSLNTTQKIESRPTAKPVADTEKPIFKFRKTEADEDTVDIGEEVHKYVPEQPDPVARKEIIQLNVFNLEDKE